jgi:uncharacterized protein
MYTLIPFVTLMLTISGSVARDFPSDCIVTKWKDETKCGFPCIEGNGSLVQRRSIISPTRGYGSPCPTLTQIVPCPFETCATHFDGKNVSFDCVVTEWSDETNCSLPCIGFDGSKVQRRSIVEPTAGSGLPCPFLTQIVSCEFEDCIDFDFEQ